MMAVNPDTLTRPLITEKQLMANVLELARWLHWRCYHTHDSRHSAAGFPDILAIRARPGAAPRLLAIELKSERGRLTGDQRLWLEDFQRLSMCAAVLGLPALMSVHVWRPADWCDGTVECVLKEA